MKRVALFLVCLIGLSLPGLAQPKRKPAPGDLVTTPLVPADISRLPDGMEQVEIYLLIGQSNMKGRGVMPEKPFQDPQIVMMHLRTDEWFHARHPLHLTGDPKTFKGADNAGVGPGLSFAQSLSRKKPTTRIALVPCARGGTAISKWQKGQRLYDETVRKAKLTLKQAPTGKARIAGAIWLQGEADSQTPEKIAAYPERLGKMIDDLRTDLGIPDLPFVACTIGELRDPKEPRAAINKILLNISELRPNTACVDSRSFAADIGDRVHFDTETQEKHGKIFAELMLKLQK